MERPTFSPNLTNARAATPYPHVELLDKSESVALVLSTLNGGDLPVVFATEKDRVQIAKIPLSALSVYSLRKVSRLLWWSSQEDNIELNDVDTIMECLRQYVQRRE